MYSKPSEIKAIIFDLGGVVLDIDYQRSIEAFKKLGFPHFEEHYNKLKQDGLFDLLEKGLITPQEFRDTLRLTIPRVSDADIDNAWNALIGDFPSGRLEFILRLKKLMPVFLLSNTNAIHLAFFDRLLKEKTEGRGLEDFFHKVYLSHETHVRKPEPEAFLMILREQGLETSSTLFIDDSPQHIAGAASLGLQTIHLLKIGELEAVLSPLLAQLHQHP